MSGAFGSIKHLHQAKNLTFGEIKTIIRDFRDGTTPIYEKFDGQNLMVTYINGEVRAARNKSSLKNPYSVIQLNQFFENHLAHVQESFSQAMLAINDLIFYIDQADFFEDGLVFLNLEIINPNTRNIIDYGEQKRIIITGAVRTDGQGNIISHSDISSVDQFKTDDMFDGWKIELYNRLVYDVNEHIEPTIYEIDKFLELHGLNDSNTVYDFTDKYVYKLIDKFKLTNQQKIQLKKRWIYGDKSLRMTHVNFGLSANEILHYEKTSLPADLVDLESTFADIIQNFGINLINTISDNDARLSNIQSILDMYLLGLQHVGNNNINVEKHLVTIKKLGGVNKLKNIEGIVFNHNDVLYKMTGLFQPINQICGFYKYKNYL